MFKTAALPEHRTALSDVAHCSNCGTLMTVVGDNYVCPVNIGGGPKPCSTTPVNAVRLVRQVITQLLKRVMTDSTIALLTGDIQRTALAKSGLQQQRLQKSEASIEGLNRLKKEVLHPVEQELTTYPEVAGEINRINAASMGLAYESKIAQDELDKLAFISDSEGLREDAQDIATCLDDAAPEETKELVNMFVRDIRVGPGSAEVFYSHPLPDEQGRARITSDLIPLDR